MNSLDLITEITHKALEGLNEAESDGDRKTNIDLLRGVKVASDILISLSKLQNVEKTITIRRSYGS